MSSLGKRVSFPLDDLTYKIIGCAMAVHRKLGPGYREDTYQRDLQVQFGEAGLSYEPQKLFEVYDSLDNGSLQYKRILPPRKIQVHLVNRQWLFLPDWLKSQMMQDGKDSDE